MKVRVKLIQRVRRLLAFALMLWCAGTGCMIVSYAHGAMNDADLAGSQTAAHSFSGASASMGSHACCKAHHSSAKHNQAYSESLPGFQQVALPEAPVSSGANNCCPLTSGSFVAASRAQSNDDNSSVSTQTDPLVLNPANAEPAPKVYPLRLPNQNRTYLRVCVFLI